MVTTAAEMEKKFLCALLHDCVSYLELYLVDRECVGFLNSPGRKAKPFDTDK